MPRSISIEGVQQLFAEESDHVVLPLIKIIHPDLSEKIRLVNNTVDISFDEGFGEGLQVWQALPFEITLPNDVEGELPSVNLAIDNIHRSIVEGIRTIQTSPQVELSIIRVDSVGSITREIGPMSFRLNNVNYDAFQVQGTLGYQADYLNEPAVKDRFDNISFPGLFS